MRNRWIAVSIFSLFLLAGSAFAANVRITKGPVVEHAGTSNAVIAWSTNTSAATIVRYGTDPNRLDQKAQMPWGGLTHRVTIKNLRPGTTYYYQVDSTEGAQSSVERFETGGGETARGRHERHPELKITNGPTLEHVSETSATVAWSTTLPSSSVVKYGTDPHRLSETAEQPWGATDHRVEMKNLRPNTRYFFSVHSAQGKNAPGQAEDTPPQEFTTAQGERAYRGQHRRP